MKNLLSLWCLLCFSLGIQAQQLTEVEYYFNLDPGFGNGIKLPATSEIETAVDISGLANGVHTLFVRAKQTNDNEDKWSLLQHRTFNKVGENPANELQKIEYYFDKDPGFGNGKPLPTDAEIETTVDISDLDEGVHTFYVRAQDNNKHWSLLQSRTFIKLPYSEPAKITEVKLKIGGSNPYAEWISISDFTPAEDVCVEFEPIIDNICGLINEELTVEVIAINDNDDASQVSVKNLNIICDDEDDYCPQILAYRIVDHESFPNQSKYEIMETGIVHHFFQLTDVDGNPLKEGIKIYYTVDYGGGLPAKKRISKPSNENGIVNLYLDTYWDDSETNESEIVLPGSTVTISFLMVDFPEEYRNNYCIENIQNDFEAIEIQVGELKPSSKEYGLFANGGVGISGCAICVPGYSLIETGVKGKIGASLSLQNKYDDLGELSSIVMKIKGKAGLDFSADIFEVNDDLLKISADGFNSNLKVWKKGYCKLGIDVSVINYLLIYYHLIKYSNLNSANSGKSTHLLEKALEKLLDKIYKENTISKLETGNSFEYGADIKLAEFDVGEIIDFILIGSSNENESVKTKFEFVTLDVNAKKESGVKIKYPDKESYFVKQSGQQKWGDIKFGAENEFNNGTFSFINTTSYENFRRGFEYSVERNITTNEKTAKINCNNVHELISIDSDPYDIEYSYGFTLNNNIMDFLREQYLSVFPSINVNNQLLKFLLQQESSPSTNLQTAYYEIDELLRQINNNSSEAFIKVNRNKFVTNKNTLVNLSIPKIELIPKIGVGIDLNFSTNIGFFSSTLLPSLSSGKYSILAKDYLWSIEYPATEKLNNLVENPFTKLWDRIVESINSNRDMIIEAVYDFIEIVTPKIKDGYTWFVNGVREYKSGKNGNVFIFEDFSKIAIGYKDDGSVFNQNTAVTLEYYYPEGEVKGLTESEDTIIIVSDLFYLNALENEEYLSKAPNGDYMISATLGKDDLAFLGMDENIEAEVFYRALDEVYWKSIGTANGDTLKYDGLGNLAIGVYLKADYESPVVEIQQKEDAKFSAFISDNMGIDWLTVSVSVNGNNVTFDRINLTNEIAFSIDSLSQIQDYIITVNAYDLLDNYGFSNISVETETATNEILVYNHLLKLFPNPAESFVNVAFQIPEPGKVKFEIIDVLGNQISQKNMEVNQINFPLVQKLVFDSVSSGVFILNIYVNDKKIEARKFLVL